MGTEGAENLIGGDVKKPGSLIFDAQCWIEPMRATGFQEVEGAVELVVMKSPGAAMLRST